MNNTKLAFIALILVLFGSAWLFFGAPPAATTFTAAQKQEMKQVIEEYLMEYPEIIVKAYQKLQKDQAEKQLEMTKSAVAENVDSLKNSGSPSMGNPEGDIILVKFLDYQCGHCKRMETVVEELIKDNPDLKVVIKELPLFGNDSEFAAKAAIAAEKQGKFGALHAALLLEKEKLTKEKVLELAKNNGIDTAILEEDIQDPKIQKQLEDVREVARKLAIRGTPFFLVMSEPFDEEAFFIVPGASPKAQLQQYINTVKESS